ncbi:serine protease inhibitor A3B-like [Rattus rattus]|uniref:serine protease inhibitor A3B-like n=1 Tax=Rattus rattus TaxID=10117 RepID=UPI0013F2ECFA|nr:serine protease inhibitor A3B-like [Rattus rattus]
MVSIASFWIIVAGICPAVLCCTDGTLGKHTNVQNGEDTQKQMYSRTLASINTDFAFSLYKELALKSPDTNIIFSPLSIATFLITLSLGAKGNTLQEILESLQFNLTETPEADIHLKYRDLLQRLSQLGDQVKLSRGNALFVEKHLQVLNEFKEKARTLYQTEVFTADFHQPCEARKLINDYLRIQSQRKIKELVLDLEKRTSMVMLNFLLFTGQWDLPFDPDDTFMGKFILDSRGPVRVPMMKIEDLTIPYFRDEELKCTVVELNYIVNGRVMFILPDQGKKEQVEASLQPEILRKWMDSLKPRIIDELHLPKFSVSKTYHLEDILPELGVREVFSKHADLSGITGDKNIRVSQMIHNTVLDIAETGTEADTTTRVEYNFMSPKINTTFVNIVRKFLYMVLEPNSEFISFIGKVINPLEN